MTNATVEFKGSANLDRLLLSNPNMEKKVINIIRKVIRQARDEVAQKAEGVPQQDPRKTAHAIRSTVYRAILGGRVDILPSKKAGSPGSYRPPRKLDSNPHQRGGNRRPRSRRCLGIKASTESSSSDGLMVVRPQERLSTETEAQYQPVRGSMPLPCLQ